ncbi:MAG TPA: Ig-like domain-containing protein, partial [Polyangia bacterium]|nr:Ig-like domain-containing protein [Polyangia bacterium]
DPSGLDGDLVAAEPSSTQRSLSSDPSPKVIYLAYADGKPLTSVAPDACRATPPKFVCKFASSTKECQRQIQAYLDRWYADFNVVFTLTRPTSGDFYTGVVSSGGGAWCSASSTTAGLAPFSCQDIGSGMSYTFLGGESPKDSAIIIAQEQAHLVGLEHTKSARDVMNPTICTQCDGFEKVTNAIDTDHCGRANQNSYQMMLDRLGAWPGGVKPSPFGCDPDGVAPSVSITSPANQASVGSSFALSVRATDDCAVKKVTVKVSPQGLQTSSNAPPYEWTLTKISGKQTITVTASDASGKTSTATVTVNAPGTDAGMSTVDAGVGDASTVDAKASDAKTDGTTTMVGADSGTAPSEVPDDGVGCACALADRGSTRAAGLAWAGLALAFGFRRRRAR